MDSSLSVLQSNSQILGLEAQTLKPNPRGVCLLVAVSSSGACFKASDDLGFTTFRGRTDSVKSKAFADGCYLRVVCVQKLSSGLTALKALNLSPNIPHPKTDHEL